MEVSKDIIYTKLWGNYVPVPQHEDQNGNMGVTGDNNPLPTREVQSDVMKPVDIQAHLQKQISTHVAASVAPNAENDGSFNNSWIDTDGFDSVAVRAFSNASLQWDIKLVWSDDQANTNGIDYFGQTNANHKVWRMATAGRYLRIRIKNADATTAQTFTASAYLKA